MNRALFTTHCYLSWGFVTPYVMAGIHVAAALRFYFKGYSPDDTVLKCNGEHTTVVWVEVEYFVLETLSCASLDYRNDDIDSEPR